MPTGQEWLDELKLAHFVTDHSTDGQGNKDFYGQAALERRVVDLEKKVSTESYKVKMFDLIFKNEGLPSILSPARTMVLLRYR